MTGLLQVGKITALRELPTLQVPTQARFQNCSKFQVVFGTLSE